MATGVPKRPKKTRKDGSGLELAYAGKAAAADVLSGLFEPFVPMSPAVGQSAIRRLYFGDNLTALRSMRSDRAVSGRVKLVYIDPPFGTQSIFHSRDLAHAYSDVFPEAEYLEFMRHRLLCLREVMSEDASIYVHIDEKMLFALKLIMDEVFGAANYRNCITRKKCNPKNYTRKTFGNVADYILFYTKSAQYTWNKQVEPWTEGRDREYQYRDADGRRYMKVPVHAPGVRKGETGMPWRGKLPPPGKHWQYTPATLDEMDARGEIFWSKNGNPRRKVYLDTRDGIGVQDIWLDYRDAHNQNIHVTGYPTEKPLALLDRIVAASSNPGDLVLDCFMGSGTTLAAAEKGGRQWIGVDQSPEALRATLKRLVKGTAPMGDFVGKKSLKTVTADLFGEQGNACFIPAIPAVDLRTCQLFCDQGGDVQALQLWVEFGGVAQTPDAEKAPSAMGRGRRRKAA